jgi:hypothetical protein
MKKLLFGIILFCSVNIFAQTDTTKLTTKYVYNDLKQGFKDMVDKLEGPAKHTYAVYVVQYKMDGIFTLAIEIFGSLFLGIAFYLTAKKATFDDKTVLFDILTVVTGVCGLIAFGFLIGDFAGNMKEILNPEFYAIDKIVSTLRGN